MNNSGANDDMDDNLTIDEIDEVIIKLKNNKAPGIDGIHGELLKHATSELHQYIKALLETIWEKEYLPKEWRTGIICPLHKKGDQMNCANYRGITLLNTTYKIFSKILYNRLLPYVEKVVENYQTGFRQGKSTIDQIFTERQILEKTTEFNIDTHHLFVDFSTAYDSINRAGLYRAMEEFGIPDKLIR